MTATWWVYMIACRGGKIYTGVARDPDRRVRVHASGKGAAFTRMNPPIALLARKSCPSRGAALAEEAALKRLPRARKEAWARAQGAATALWPESPAS